MASIIAKFLEVVLAIGYGAAAIPCTIEFYQPNVPQELKK